MSLSLSYINNIVASNSTFNFAIDPLKFSETREINFVTHAHRDHINMTKKSKEMNFIMMLEYTSTRLYAAFSY